MRRLRFALISAAAAALLLLCGAEAWARIGGGESFGGGGGGSGGGGGDGDAAVIMLVVRMLIWLCFEHPAVGIPLTLVVVTGGAFYLKRRGQTEARHNLEYSAPVRRPSPAAPLQKLRAADPGFSLTLFLDFVRLLYSRLHEARGPGRFDSVRPYVLPQVLATLPRPDGLAKVKQVIIGSAKITDFGTGIGAKRQAVTVLIEANYTEINADGLTQRFYAKESWVFGRKAGVLSQGPGKLDALGCPSCGASLELDVSGKCGFCDQVVTGGNFHWQLERVVGLARGKPQPPVLGKGGGVEAGTRAPTVYAPDFAAQKRKFQTRYPEFAWTEFDARVRHAFVHLNQAWSSLDWTLARPYETDHLFDTHRFWIEQYQQAGLVNKGEDLEIQKVELCKVEQDGYFDAVTVRIFARMRDFTVDSQGKVVAGSEKQPREYSEYWTFVRTIGAKGRGDKQDDQCPSCGAPIKLSMAGVCEYCEARVTSGEFDWVLSAIDQDETYSG